MVKTSGKDKWGVFQTVDECRKMRRLKEMWHKNEESKVEEVSRTEVVSNEEDE